jgi:hypothetical protein
MTSTTKRKEAIRTLISIIENTSFVVKPYFYFPVLFEVIENLVNNGIDRDSKLLGCYYVLGSLTLVNTDAATCMPWLFQSFNYF